jgi:phage terminase small subunit
MPGLPLQNLRWERFCQAYVHGETSGNATASYVAAGFAADGTDVSRRVGAYRLLHKPPVRARIAELESDRAGTAQRAVAAAADRLSLSKQLVLAQLARLGFANVLDYVRRSETGGVVIDLGAVRRDEAAGIVELAVTEKGEGPDRVSVMRLKLCDRHAPLVSLGKHLGLFTDKKDPQDHLRHLTIDDLKRRRAELEQEIDRLISPPARPAAETPPSASEGAEANANEFERVGQSKPDVS